MDQGDKKDKAKNKKGEEGKEDKVNHTEEQVNHLKKLVEEMRAMMAMYCFNEGGRLDLPGGEALINVLDAVVDGNEVKLRQLDDSTRRIFRDDKQPPVQKK